MICLHLIQKCIDMKTIFISLINLFLITLSSTCLLANESSSLSIYTFDENSFALEGASILLENNQSKKIDSDMLSNFDLVITLCGDAKDKCPVITSGEHIHWDISDPAKFIGSFEEVRQKYSKVRDIIYNNIQLLKDKL